MVIVFNVSALINEKWNCLSAGSDPRGADQGPEVSRFRLRQIRRPLPQPHQRLRLLFWQDAGRPGQHGGVPALCLHPHQVRVQSNVQCWQPMLNLRMESNVHTSRKRYEAAALRETLSTRSLAVNSLERPALFTHGLNRTSHGFCTRELAA